MAKSTTGAIMEGIQGKVGNVVFRRRGDQFVISRRPLTSEREPSAGQAAQRERFRAAAAYAHQSMGDPVVKALYAAWAQRRGFTVFNTAVADYFGAPVVNAIDLSEYHGQAGDRIHIRASDDTDVLRVQVEVRDAQGALIEEGPAQEVTPDGGDWTYTATRPATGQTVVTATAFDRPGNTGTLTKA